MSFKKIFFIDEEYTDYELYTIYVNVLFLDEGEMWWDDEYLDVSFDDAKYILGTYLKEYQIIPLKRSEFQRIILER